MSFILRRYGDKTPRSLIGRLFGVLWILLGLIVITMFTATVTSALTLSSSPQFSNSLEGQDVSVAECSIRLRDCKRFPFSGHGKYRKRKTREVAKIKT